MCSIVKFCYIKCVIIYSWNSQINDTIHLNLKIIPKTGVFCTYSKWKKAYVNDSSVNQTASVRICAKLWRLISEVLKTVKANDIRLANLKKLTQIFLKTLALCKCHMLCLMLNQPTSVPAKKPSDPQTQIRKYITNKHLPSSD